MSVEKQQRIKWQDSNRCESGGYDTGKNQEPREGNGYHSGRKHPKVVRLADSKLLGGKLAK